MNLNFLFRYKIHHVLGWIVYFSISAVGYYSYYTNKVDLLLVTLVYIVSHALMYYISQHLIAPLSFKIGKFWLFFFSFAGLGFFLSCLMYLFIFLILGEKMTRYFGENFWQVFPVFLISNFFMGGLLIGVKSIIDRIRQQKLDKKKKEESLLSELNYLKAQVNPHFLFNTINSVYVLIKIDPDRAAEMLIKLSDLLRSQLYDFSEKHIRIEEEINYLENYIELEKLRKAHRVEVTVEKNGNLTGFSLPPLLLIPFLENCFKHLSSYTDQPNKVFLRIERTEKGLDIEFINTYDAEPSPQKGGIGLANIQRRLTLLFPKQHQLSIQKQDGLHKVNLKLNISHDA